MLKYDIYQLQNFTLAKKLKPNSTIEIFIFYEKATKIRDMVMPFYRNLTSRANVMPVQNVKFVMPKYVMEAAILVKCQSHNATV